jgi:RNA polymerase sigma factor (sigma-70 family)
MNKEEFSEILRCYGDIAYRMACHLTQGNEALSRDLVQDAFVKIWKSGDLQNLDSFKGWMYRILHNLYIDHLRRQSRNATFSYDAPAAADDSDLKESLPHAGPTILENLEKEELNRRLRQALDGLPDEFRIPVVLCDMEGLSYEEIARIVACPVGTVRSRIHRGRCELRRTLVHLMGQASTAGEMEVCL